MANRGVVRRLLTDCAIELSTLASRSEVDHAAAVLIGRALAADDVLHTEIDLAQQAATVRSGTALQFDGALSEGLGGAGHMHPAVVSYLAPGDDRRPRRVSDVVPHGDWLNSPAYIEVFRGRGAVYQLSLVTELNVSRGSGWVLTRSASDFSDEDLDVAGDLLPYLIAMAELAKLRPIPPPRGELTQRELVVLHLLADGLAAGAIGRQMHISEATVRKHLEHIYTKLRVHDRLSAVMRALQIGYL